MSCITKFEKFKPSLLAFGEPKSGRHGQVYIPIRYNGERLQFATGKCFSWGLKRIKRGRVTSYPLF